MQYDLAGNLTNDTYTGAGNRTYDAENKITSAWGGNNQAQVYGYDATGQRIKRTVNGVETWQVYGLGGELLAEYAANSAVANPQKEYGYRNGQLLVTAEPGTAESVNVALSANGGVATASSSYDPACAVPARQPRMTATEQVEPAVTIKSGMMPLLPTPFLTRYRSISTAVRRSRKSM